MDLVKEWKETMDYKYSPRKNAIIKIGTTTVSFVGLAIINALVVVGFFVESRAADDSGAFVYLALGGYFGIYVPLRAMHFYIKHYKDILDKNPKIKIK